MLFYSVGLRVVEFSRRLTFPVRTRSVFGRAWRKFPCVTIVRADVRAASIDCQTSGFCPSINKPSRPHGESPAVVDLKFSTTAKLNRPGIRKNVIGRYKYDWLIDDPRTHG